MFRDNQRNQRFVEEKGGTPWRGCNDSSGRLNADYADCADLFRDNQRNQRFVKANELVRFAEVPPCFGKLTKLILKFNFLLISRAKHGYATESQL